jgi:CRISPR/Cas system-associated exonuclease Cas4 (RecB family)
MLSVTSLSSYMYCSRKLYMERVLRLAEPPKEALVLGTIRHSVFDQLNKKDEDFVKSINDSIDEKTLVDKYNQLCLKILKLSIVAQRGKLESVGLSPLDAYKDAKDNVLKATDLRAKNLWNFMEQHKIFGEELWLRLVPKIVSEQSVESRKMNLRGIVDHIEEYGDMYIPVELKTGSAPREGCWDSHKIQIGAYILILNEMRGSDIKKGIVRYLDVEEDRAVIMNPFLK